jgi:hypothetical protein
VIERLWNSFLEFMVSLPERHGRHPRQLCELSLRVVDPELAASQIETRRRDACGVPTVGESGILGQFGELQRPMLEAVRRLAGRREPWNTVRHPDDLCIQPEAGIQDPIAESDLVPITPCDLGDLLE